MKPGEAVRVLAQDGLVVPRFDEVDRFTDLPFPIPALLSEELPADDGLELWRQARSLRHSTGLTPVLIGAEPIIDWFLSAKPPPEQFGRSTNAATPLQGRAGLLALQRIRKARPLSVDAARDQLKQQLSGRFSAEVVERLHAQMAAIRPAWKVSLGATAPEIPRFRFLDDDEPVRCVLLGCTPGDVPRFLGLGGFNGSPVPSQQAAFLTDWHERFATELVHVGRGTVEMITDQPPLRVEDVSDLLWDTLLYCCDAVFQDSDATFASLRRMLTSPHWTFSWD